MLFLVLAGLAGAGAALALLWALGALIACIAAPFGGAIAASIAALWLGRRSKEVGSDKQTTDDLPREVLKIKGDPPRSEAGSPTT